MRSKRDQRLPLWQPLYALCSALAAYYIHLVTKTFQMWRLKIFKRFAACTALTACTPWAEDLGCACLINRLFDRLGAINGSLATLKLVDTLVQLPPRMAAALVSWSPEQKVKVYRSYNRN
jgi:hypothetical protein